MLPLINLYHADSLDAMRQMADKQYDLAIVDPEYGIGESKRTQSRPLTAKQKNGTRLPVKGARKHTPKDWDAKRPEAEYFHQLRRVSKNQIIWGGNHFADLLPPSSGWIVWDKVNQKSDQSDCELAWTSFPVGVRQIEYMWNGFNQGRSLAEGRKSQGDKKRNEVRIHPTQKPVLLYKWLLHNYAQPGWSLLDTHGGSMSLAIACYDLGISVDIWERDDEYFEAARTRFCRHTSQRQVHTLFALPQPNDQQTALFDEPRLGRQRKNRIPLITP